MTHILSIDGGAPEYWQGLRRGHTLIVEARAAYARAKSARLYRCEGYDDDGEPIISENIAPFDAFEEACKAVEGDIVALSILRAQGVHQIGTRVILPW